MKELIDNKTNLIIRNFTDDELIENSSIQNEINSWSDDEAIKEYITSNCVWTNKLFDYLFGLNNLLNNDDPDFSELYFAFDDNEELQAIFQLSKTQNKFTKAIQFLVVNPQTQNRGIGTRIFNSILKNSEFFKKLKSQLFLVSASEKSNNASRRLLKKQGFIPYKKVNNSTLCLYIKLWKAKEMGE